MRLSDWRRRVTSCDACLVYLAESESGEFVLRASLLPHISDLGNLRVKMGEGVTGWVAEHQSPVALSSKAAADPRSKIFPTLVEDTYQAFLVRAGDQQRQGHRRHQHSSSR